jgi:DNA-binding IclR family transcriptional regulator
MEQSYQKLFPSTITQMDTKINLPKAESPSRTINRICDILNSFSDHEAYLTLTEISIRIQLPKSTTFRFLEALESQGMIHYDSNHKGYRLGHRLIHLGMLAQASIDLRNDALPILRSLTEETGETSILSMRFGSNGTWVEMIESRQPVRLAMRVGQPLLLHAGASSKVLLAFLPEDEIERILGQMDLVPIATNTITDPERLKDELRIIREHGYATSFEETDEGAMGIAAPVFDHTGRPIAGIGIAAPIVRIPREQISKILDPVLNASRKLSKQLGAICEVSQTSAASK